MVRALNNTRAFSNLDRVSGISQSLLRGVRKVNFMRCKGSRCVLILIEEGCPSDLSVSFGTKYDHSGALVDKICSTAAVVEISGCEWLRLLERGLAVIGKRRMGKFEDGLQVRLVILLQEGTT